MTSKFLLLTKYIFAFLSLAIASSSSLFAQEQFNRSPTREGVFAIFETAAGYDISPYEISKTVEDINNEKVSVRKYNKLLKGESSEELAWSALILGWQAAFRGEFDKSTDYLQTHLEVRKDIGKAQELMLAHLYLGYSLYQYLDYKSALLHFQSSLDIANKLNNDEVRGATTALIGQSHLVSGNLLIAKEFFSSAMKTYDRIGYRREFAFMLVEIAEINVRKNDLTEAVRDLEKAQDIFKKVDDKPMQGIVSRDLGLIFFRDKKYESALNSFHESISITHEISVAKLMRDTYLRLYTLSSLLQNHEQSNDYHLKYIQLRDSIETYETSRVRSSQLTRKELLTRDRIEELLETSQGKTYDELTTEELTESQQVLEDEIGQLEQEMIIEDLSAAKRRSEQLSVEREEKIKQLTREKALQEAALSKKELLLNRQQTVRNTLLIIALFSLIIVFLLYNRFRQQKKSHLQLDKAYNELSETHTQLVSTQKQLVLSQKMASIGQMTAGVAHEIQNPLNFVNNFSELTLELVSEVQNGETPIEDAGPVIIENIEKIHEHGLRADKIVKGMLMHSRSSTAEKAPADINKMLDELIELVYHGNNDILSGTDVTIIRDFQSNIPKVNVVAGDISRVFVNLYNNAFYSMGHKKKKGGDIDYKPTLTISTKQLSDAIEIRIIDNGIGISDENKEKVFDPFFTTKSAGTGTGLGLSLSYEIISNGHGGTMALESSEGENCCFIINLPT